MPVENSVNVSALIASGAISFDPLASDGEQQTIGWHYNPAAADLDWLRAGDTLTLTYVAQVNDGAGNVGAQNLVITITGTNDVPTIDAATNPAAIAESAGDSSAQDIAAGQRHHLHHRPGPRRHPHRLRHRQCHRLLQRRPVPVENSVNVSALIASGAISFDPLASDGEQQTIGWHYNPAAADLDWLRAGDTLTLTYVAQVNDGAGNVGAQNLVITITGTNDVPTIDAATNPAAIAESAGDSSAQDIAAGQRHHLHHRPGPRRHPHRLRHRQCHRLLQRRPVPVENSVNVSALIASGAISFDPLVSDGEQQTIGWHYNPAAADLDWLRAGDTLTLTYVAQVNDGAGNVGAQNLVITITGTNDVPTIDAATNPAAIAESGGDSSAQDIAAGQRHHLHHRPGPRRHPHRLRHRQCHRLLQRRPVPVENSVNVSALIASGAISFDPLVSDGEQQTIGWPTTRPPPTSTGCAQATPSPSPTSPRSMTAPAMSAPRTW